MFRRNTFQPLLVAAVVAVSHIATTTTASAGYPGYVKADCKSDFKTFCPKYDIDSKQLRLCMRSVANQLSPRCVTALERSGERRSR